MSCHPEDRVIGARVRRERKCDTCSGRGWVIKGVPGSDWAEPCTRCDGCAAFRTMKLAKLLGVHRRDVYRVEKLTAGSRIGARVLDAIAKHFPELFA